MDVDLDRDRLLVVYDPALLAPEQFVEVVRKHGFQAALVPDEPPAKPPGE